MPENAASTGQWIASGSFDGSIRLWHGKTGIVSFRVYPFHLNLGDRNWSSLCLNPGKFVATLRGHVGAVYQLAWSGDSRLLASGSKDSTVKVCAIPVVSAMFMIAQFGKRLTVAVLLQIWETKTRKVKEDLPGHADEVYTVDWSPDGERVASGGKDRNLKMWRR